MTLALITLTAILLLGAGFLGKELLKKFKILRNHVEHSERAVAYKWSGTKKLKMRRGMYDLVVTSDLLGTSWGATVYVESPLGKNSGMDPFAYLPYGREMKVIRLWLGRTPTTIWFVPDGNARLSVALGGQAVPSSRNPDVLAKPHWWQRLGIAG